MFEVYELWDPTNGECFYVGKGSCKRSRLGDHLRQARYLREGKSLTDNNPFKARTICRIQDAGLEPEYRVVFVTENEAEALLFEIDLIQKYGRRNLNTGTLVNLTDGGEGVRGWKVSRPRVSSMKGKTMPEHAKARIREAALGRKHSPETKQKISLAQLGRKDSDETKARKRAALHRRLNKENNA